MKSNPTPFLSATCFSMASILASTSSVLAYTTTGAVSLGQVGQNVGSSMNGVNIAIHAFCYLAALVMAILAILKFKDIAPNVARSSGGIANTPVAVAIAYAICAGLFAFAPELIGTAGATIWGEGAQAVKPTLIP